MFNVDWFHDSYHTECSSDFVATHILHCMSLNTRFNTDYISQFSMERLSVIAHFLLVRYDLDKDADIVHNLLVEHDADICSENDPSFLVLIIHISQICSTRHVSCHRVNWFMAGD
jgi:hypothetical protein